MKELLWNCDGSGEELGEGSRFTISCRNCGGTVEELRSLFEGTRKELRRNSDQGTDFTSFLSFFRAWCGAI